MEFVSILEDAIATDKDFTPDNTNYYKFLFNYDNFAYIRQAAIADIFRVKKGYQATHKNFKDFCPDFFRLSYSQIRKIIQAGRVAVDLIKAGFELIPQNKTQALELAGVPRDELPKVWENILETFDFVQLTANKIKNYLDPPPLDPPINRKIEISDQLYKDLRDRANEHNQPIQEVIRDLLDEEPEVISPEKINEWQEDLSELAREHQSNINSITLDDSQVKDLSNF